MSKQRDKTKGYFYKGKRLSFAASSKPIAKQRKDWSWLDPEIYDFINSEDLYRDFVLEDFTLSEIRHLKDGVRGRLRCIKFKGSGVKINSKNFYDSKGRITQIKLQLVKT